MKRTALRILVTAGPTREYLDPIRFISNESSGVMGLACAQEAHRRGHRVKLILGPPHPALSPPWGERIKMRGEQIPIVRVITAREMLSVLQREWHWADALIMAAAVCDFRPQRTAATKISKTSKVQWILKLVRNPDLLQILSKRKQGRCLIGFSLETQKGFTRAREKVLQKGLDLIVCNWVQKTKRPFGDQPISVAFLDNQGSVQWLRNVSKQKIAKELVDKLEQICYQKRREGGGVQWKRDAARHLRS